MNIAKREIGVKEIPGDQSDSRILEYHKHTSGKFSKDEIPWCSSFVNFVMYKSGYLGTRSAMARSWLEWGDYLPVPRYGCIVILSRGTSPLSGHVGFYCKAAPFLIDVLGGNQDDQVKNSWYKSSNVLGYRWPLLSDRVSGDATPPPPLR